MKKNFPYNPSFVSLKSNRIDSFLTGVEGENRFGTAPKTYGRVKSLVIDLELLAA
jgi:hypothetical protein